MSRGYIATITILIVMAVAVATATTVTLLSINEAQSSFALFKGENTLGFVEGCVEDGLLKARASPTFGEPIGNPVFIDRPEGTCRVTVDSKSGSTWTMTVTTEATDYKRNIQVVLERIPSGITITSWKEV